MKGTTQGTTQGTTRGETQGAATQGIPEGIRHDRGRTGAFGGSGARRAVSSAGLGVFLAVAAAALAGGCGSQDEERPATWNYIATAIIEPNCATANCHSSLAQRSGVQLDRENRAYHALVDRFFVIPGDPDNSALMFLLRGEGSRRMPPDFPLADQDIALIGTWIQNGAKP